MFQGQYKGMHVRVWRVRVNHGVSYLDLKRAYSRCVCVHLALEEGGWEEQWDVVLARCAARP